MLLDMHMHIWPESRDSHMTLEEAVEQAKKMGLDGICITDHDALEIRKRAERYSVETSYPIFVGVEILTFEGDVVVFGLDEVPEEMMSLEELLELVEGRGGAAIAAHPFRRNNRGVGDNIRDVYAKLAGVEVLNGNTPLDLNIRSDKLTRELGCGRIGGSDAHYKHEVGRYATKFSRKIESLEELIGELRRGEYHPATYDGRGYHINDGIKLLGNKGAGIIMNKGA